MYELSSLHDSSINYNGIKPYRSPEFVSVYDGITVEIHIVNHCNLNCAGCNHFSPLAQPWEIDVEYFTKQLLALKENISTVKHLILLGGEPTLHSRFTEICLRAREIFPNILIEVLSNGVKINQIEKDIDKLKEANIKLMFCEYFNYTDSNKIKELGLNYFNSRSLMHQTLVDESGSQNKENNFFYCGNYTLPCFTLKDYKLYICPFSAHFSIYSQKSNFNYLEKENIDFLDVRKIQNNMDVVQDFCFTPKDYCAYCKATSATWVWQKSARDVFEFNTELYDMYLKDYPRYEKMTNSNFPYFLTSYTDKNPAKIDYAYAADKQEKLLLRLGTGKIDIIIPHYNTDISLIDRLVKSLLAQTIISDCVIYFVSDCSSKDEEFLRYIIQQPLNIVLLKTPSNGGPGIARNYGINFGYNKYILFFDSDDYFINPNALEELYNKIEEGYDALTFIMYNTHNNRINPMVRRSFIQENNIRYLPLYFGEDMNFIADLRKNTQNIFEYNNSENLFAYYDISNKDSLTNVFGQKDFHHLNFITSKFKSFKDGQITFDAIKDFYDFIKFNRQILTNDLMKAYIYYILYFLYKKAPDLYFSACEGDSRATDYINNSLYVALSNKILTSEDEILIFLKSRFSEITSTYLKPAAQVALTLLD